MAPTTLGSLMVQAHPIRSPRWAPARSTNRANRSGASSASKPPRAASHVGLVKWWNVTTGTIPRSWQPAHMPPVVVQRCHRELSLGRFDAAPLQREPVGARVPFPPPGRGPPPPMVRIAGIPAGLDTPRTRVCSNSHQSLLVFRLRSDGRNRPPPTRTRQGTRAFRRWLLPYLLTIPTTHTLRMVRLTWSQRPAAGRRRNPPGPPERSPPAHPSTVGAGTPRRISTCCSKESTTSPSSPTMPPG